MAGQFTSTSGHEAIYACLLSLSAKMSQSTIIPDASFSDPQHLALRRLVRAIRRVVAHSVHMIADAETLNSLAEHAESLADAMQPNAGTRPFDKFYPPRYFLRDEPSLILPFSMIGGIYNPIAAPLRIEHDGDTVIVRVSLGDVYEGPHNCVHGGMVSALWDQILGYANVKKETGGPTAWLSIKYRAPTPLHTELRFEACVDRIEGRKIFTAGRCYAGDKLVTEAEALFIHYESVAQKGMWENRRESTRSHPPEG